jgi:acyl carrier protein
MSELFFVRAKEKFGHYPFLHFGLLNVEEDPQAQGYGRHSFDVVVAANVLHATKNLDETLAHARSLLAPGGLLLLYETTTHPTWFEVSIGLIEGWSRFEDEWRDEDPLLQSARWQEALQANGFTAVSAWPDDDSPAAVLGSHVLAAQVASEASGERADPALERQTVTGPTMETAVSAGPSLRQQLDEALSDERREILVDCVRRHVIQVTRRDPNRPLDQQARLMDMGVDSLMAVELKTRLNKGLELEQPLPATLVFDYPTIAAIVGYLEQLLVAGETAATSAMEEVPDHTAAEANIKDLSDDEIETLLLEKLDNI